MVLTLPQRDIFGEIGGSVGQGFGESFNKGIERKTLSEGIKKLGEKPNQTELERLASILSLPGGAEHAQAILPALRNVSQAKAQEERLSKAVEPIVNRPSYVQTKPPIKEESSYIPREAIKKTYQNLKTVPDPTEIQNLGLKLYNQGEYPTINEANQAAENFLGKEVNAQATNLAKLESDIEKEAASRLQIPGLFQDYSNQIGELTNDLKRFAVHKVVAEGKTPQDAANEVSTDLRDIGRAMVNVQSVPGRSLTPGGPNEMTRIEHLKTARKTFEKFGAEELYDDLAAASADITPMKAASFLDPLENKSLEKEISKFRFSLKPGYMPKTLGDKDMEKIVSKITPQDNILSVEYQLRKHRISIPEFQAKIKQPEYYNKLTDKQKMQLAKKAVNSVFDDLTFETF